MFKLSRTAKAVHLCILQFVCSAAYAVDITYGVDLSLSRVDNINLVPNPTEKEWVEIITGRLAVTENTANLVANLNTSVSSINYRNDLQQDATVKTLNLNSLWIIKPRHFEWFLSDVFTQTVVDPLASNTQSNRQDTNAFSTGPNYYWRLNSRHNINLEARLGSISFENSVGNNNTLGTNVIWQYLVNSALTASLNYDIQRIDLKDNTQSDYTTNDIFAAVNYIRARNTFDAELGVTYINYDAANNTSGQRYRLALTNQRTSSSTIQLEYNRRKTDTASQLFANASGGGNTGTQGGSLNTTIGTTDVFVDENYLVTYNKTLVSGNYQINLRRNELTYETQTSLNQVNDTVSLLATYNFSQTSSISLAASRIDTTFKNQSPIRNDKDTIFSANYFYNASRDIRLGLSYDTIERESTDVTSIYKDKRITATLSYSPR